MTPGQRTSPKTCQSVKSKSWEIKGLGKESGQLWSKNPSRRRFLDKIKKTWTKMSWCESKRFRAPKQDFRGQIGSAAAKRAFRIIEKGSMCGKNSSSCYLTSGQTLQRWRGMFPE